ncbi:putative membrane protein [Agromyces sp. 3263]|uniref:DUF7507 domain-containing protein n=1 Tax=Agromyces sp. 3263 TaxID=2817750 RepID=UPI00285A295C|nr:hypothetical protein [Agromyces sp. 3263]MDR6906037.1 putative membrane protein [Agromyces sp. 3263]
MSLEAEGLAAVAAGPQLAAAAAATGCSYATSGVQAANICWLDFAGFNATTARTTGQDFALGLPGGYTANFNIFTGGANAAGLNAGAQGSNSGVWATAYPGVTGRPILQRNTTGTTTVQLRNFGVTDSLGVAVPNFGMVAGDGESTGFSESLSFSTTGTPWTLVTKTQYGCGATITGLGTNTVRCQGVNPQFPGAYGTAVFATKNPTSYTVSLVNTQLGTEAAVFGFQTATLTLNKAVNGRVNPADSFDTTITSAQGTVLGSATTGAGASSTTGPITLLPGSQPFTLAETPTAGSTPLDEYLESWSCTNENTASTTVLPSGSGTSKTIVLGIGDAVTCTVTNTAGSPELSLDKVLTGNADEDGSGTVSVGDTLSYSLTATNVGDVAIDDVVVSDALTGASQTCAAVPVAGTCVLSTTHVVTQAEADAGQVVNTGSVVSPQTPDPVTDTETVPVPQHPSLSIVKVLVGNADEDGSGTVSVGDSLSYTLTGTNTGDITLTGVVVSDDLTGDSQTCASVLLLGTCVLSTTHVVTQAEADAGEVVNTGSAVADQVPTPVTDVETVPVPQAPALTLVKSASPSDAASFVPGTEITYSFVVTNSGNVTVENPQVVEVEFTGNGPALAVDCPVTPVLLPQAQMTCTATYTVLQEDVDASGIDNTATASGIDPNGDEVVSPEDSAPIPVDAAPALTIDKSSSGGPFTQAGQVVTYSFLVTNTGNVTVADIAVADDAGPFTGSGTLSPVACDATTLLPGATTTCTATYELTQADVDHGSVANTANAQGTAAGDPLESPSDTEIVSIAPAPALTIAKTGEPDDPTEAGQQITYSFVVTNTGNVTLTDVAVAELEFTGNGVPPAVTCPADEVDSLAPGDDVTCTATYTLIQADVDAGGVTNTADATGSTPIGLPVSAPPSEFPITIVASPAWTLLKTVSPTAATRAGDQLTYSFLITNTGNVTLTEIGVNDEEFTGTGTISGIDCPETSLAPAEDVTCTATYVLTQADVDAGGVTNTATASSTPPNAPPGTSPESSAAVTVDEAPALEVVKGASPVTVTAAGQVVTYSFVLTNTGNVTLHDVVIAEGEFTGTGTISAIDCPADPVAPGDDLICSATYVATQADLDAGDAIVNTATASGITPLEVPVTSVESEPATVEVEGVEALQLDITVDTPVVSGPGQTVNYTFTVTNTGTVTLSDVGITGVNFTGSGGVPTIVCPTGDVAPGERVVCTATYLTTEADAAAGRIDLTASATATGPDGEPVQGNQDEVEVALPGTEPPAAIPPAASASTGLAHSGVEGSATAAIALLLVALGAAFLVLRRIRPARRR